MNINHLQRQADVEGELFRTISWQGRYRYSFDEATAVAHDTVHRKCHQGQFVASIDGELFGSRHTADPDQLLDMMRSALDKWEGRNTQKSREMVGPVERDERHVWSFPEEGLVLHLGCRDLFDESDAADDWRFDAHNQNYVWLTKQEMQSIVPDDVKVGDRFALPDVVHRRIVRFHFLDIVRGETPPWPKEAPESVRMSLECFLIDEDHVSLRLTGEGMLVEAGDWCTQPVRRSVYKRGEMCCSIGERGFEPRILGYLTFDRKQHRFVRFDVVVVGTRWGGTTFNFRQEDVEPAGLGIAMTIAGPHERDRTPPASSSRRYFNA